MKRLIVNADDFGFTRDVNAGIVEAHRNGILTSTTLMADGAAFEDAVRLARQYPTLDVGCHLVLVGGQGLPATVGQMMTAVAARRLDPYRTLRAQIEKIVAAGIRPSHFDTHKHTFLFPPVLIAVARLSAEFGVHWVRRPFVPLAGAWHRAVLRRHGCRFTDHFVGFGITGKFSVEGAVSVVRALGEGSTEFMTHPGRHTVELAAAGTRLKESRERELEALTSREVRQATVESGVELTRYSAMLH